MKRKLPLNHIYEEKMQDRSWHWMRTVDKSWLGGTLPTSVRISSPVAVLFEQLLETPISAVFSSTAGAPRDRWLLGSVALTASLCIIHLLLLLLGEKRKEKDDHVTSLTLGGWCRHGACSVSGSRQGVVCHEFRLWQKYTDNNSKTLWVCYEKRRADWNVGV